MHYNHLGADSEQPVSTPACNEPRLFRIEPSKFKSAFSCRTKSAPRIFRFFANSSVVKDGESMASPRVPKDLSAAPLSGGSLLRRHDERIAVEALTRGLLRALEDGWSLEVSQPEGSYRGLFGKSFVRLFPQDAQSA